MNTNVENGIPASNAMTPSQCQNACQRNSSCMGVDWLSVQPSGSRCWMSGPWSGRRNDGTAAGVVHYDITRNCPCKTYLLFVFDIDLILFFFHALHLSKLPQLAYCVFIYTVSEKNT